MLIKYRDYFIIFGAVICFIEFLAIDIHPGVEYSSLIGALHIVASVVLLITLILYVTMWKIGWILFLRIIFAGFIVLMMVQSFKAGYNILSLVM